MRVAVVGAGIAGLRTAQLLERLGLEVKVYEARHRLGGRLLSADVRGTAIEAGGEWIDAEHHRVLALLGEHGLKAAPSDPRPRKLYFDGGFVAPKDFHGLEQAVRETKLTDGSLADALDAATQGSPLGRKYLEAVALSDEGTDSDQVSLVEWKRFAANYSARNDCDAGMSAFRFPVSTSELCVRMAGALKREVQTGTIVESVQRSSRVRLGLSYGLSGVFDEVVLAVPPSCLGRIKFDGARSWDGIAMTPTCKLALLFDRAFWEDEGWSGHLMSDLAVQQVWPCGRALVCYVNGRAAEALAAQMDPVGFALASLSQAVPQTREHFVEGKLFDWSREEFSGGGFPYVPPDAKRQAPPPSGPVRFAGDWTADWIGFIEGALESAERVANEFKDEHGLS